MHMGFQPLRGVGVLILSLQGLRVTNGRTFRLMGGKSVALQRLLLLLSLQPRRRPPLPADTIDGSRQHGCPVPASGPGPAGCSPAEAVFPRAAPAAEFCN